MLFVCSGFQWELGWEVMEGWELPSRLLALFGWTDPNHNAGWIDTCLTDDRSLELQQEKRGAVHPLHPRWCPQLVGARLDAQQTPRY